MEGRGLASARGRILGRAGGGRGLQQEYGGWERSTPTPTLSPHLSPFLLFSPSPSYSDAQLLACTGMDVKVSQRCIFVDVEFGGKEEFNFAFGVD